MRPLSGDPVLRSQRSHSSSFGDNTTASLAMPTPNQMTFFMADEKTVEEAGPSVRISRSHRNLKQPDYGVESLATTISSLGHDSDDAEDEDVSRARQRWKKNMAPSLTRSVLEGSSISRSRSPKSSADISRDLSPLEFRPRRSSRTTLSAPLTPVFAGSSGPGSVLSSAHSRRDSDAASSMDDNASQAIIFSEEEEKELPSGPVDTGSAPQLVMPSLQMPSRRPFTDKGKNMGRLKVLIAGDSGVGKTSLVKAIVQTCEDIVHVDPISSTTVAIPEPSRRKSKSKSKNPSMQSTSQITEIYASTRPYPSWWSELDESRVLRRRKSMGDTVLERNLCFVDTPGYSSGTSCMECITPVVQYMESYFERVSSLTNISDGELINLMSGSGGSQVDVVFYVFLNRKSSVNPLRPSILTPSRSQISRHRVPQTPLHIHQHNPHNLSNRVPLPRATPLSQNQHPKRTASSRHQTLPLRHPPRRRSLFPSFLRPLCRFHNHFHRTRHYGRLPPHVPRLRPTPHSHRTSLPRIPNLRTLYHLLAPPPNSQEIRILALLHLILFLTALTITLLTLPLPNPPLLLIPRPRKFTGFGLGRC